MSKPSQFIRLRAFPITDNNGYGHVRVFFDAVEVDEDGSSHSVSFSTVRDITCDGLIVSCQTDKDWREDRAAYAFEVQYHERHAIRLLDAERFVKTLKKISKGLEKLSRDFGYCATYGDYVARVAQIVKAEELYVDQTRVHSTGDFGREINKLVDQVNRKLRP